MGVYPFITKLFERRQFNEKERQTMRELYQQTEMLAERMAATLPESCQVVDAIHKLKESLALCEEAVAMNPMCDKQMGLPMGDAGQGAETSTAEMAAGMYRNRADALEKDAAELRMKAAHLTAPRNVVCGSNVPAYARV